MIGNLNFINMEQFRKSELGISTNAENITQTTQATFNGKRYDVEMVVSYKCVEES